MPEVATFRVCVIGQTMRVNLRLKLTICSLISLVALPGATALLLDSSAENDPAGRVLAAVASAAFILWVVLFVRGIWPRGKEFAANFQARSRRFCFLCGMAGLFMAGSIWIPAIAVQLVMSGLAVVCVGLNFWFMITSIPADL